MTSTGDPIRDREPWGQPSIGTFEVFLSAISLSLSLADSRYSLAEVSRVGGVRVMKAKDIGTGILVIGLVAVNVIYLGDIVVKGEEVIILGTKSGFALVVANLVTLGGLVLLLRPEKEASPGGSAGSGQQDAED